jgi:hypothetical protein
MTDNKNLLLHYLDKYRTEPDPAKWRAAIVAMFDERAKDTDRIDWLADPKQKVASLLLPTECVLANINSLRAAIDAARAKEVSE